jgi:hypothetical protein
LRFHPLIIAALAATLMVAAPGTPRAEEATALGTGTDSVAAPMPLESTEARTAYRAAWAQRQAGDFAGVIATSERALSAIEQALSASPDATERRELVDLKSKLEGLKQAAHKDAETASNAAAAGNDADEKVLNAPAVEDIQPQLNPDVYR